ncbi:MAG: hypothetical protein LAKADJCE_00092 [Candidatus Argoarchaeum ethanivorans]|uniref:Uncharacterized protein n=1 Tax=Candidatus Argoarchaeum ethanivorans TaxID=2608793 RepID=A0A811T6X8_9EURY|nr:MAG: hypothetical protein LAKADJCE_00092 [Candidatus Argoarchaeum ethanivorans]
MFHVYSDRQITLALQITAFTQMFHTSKNVKTEHIKHLKQDVHKINQIASQTANRCPAIRCRVEWLGLHSKKIFMESFLNIENILLVVAEK